MTRRSMRMLRFYGTVPRRRGGIPNSAESDLMTEAGHRSHSGAVRSLAMTTMVDQPHEVR